MSAKSPVGWITSGWALLSLAIFAPSAAVATCSESPMTAVFVIDDFYDAPEPTIQTLVVEPVGPTTYPTVEEMIEILIEFGSPLVNPAGYSVDSCFDPVCLFTAEPGDVGASALLDNRDGRVLFYGTVIWLGEGEILYPLVSSHEWSITGGDPASAPALTGVFDNYAWNSGLWPPSDIVDDAIEYLRNTDVLKSFASCGSYDVAAYIYTPIPHYGVDPETASLVLVVSGYCGPPWNDTTTASPPTEQLLLDLSISPNPCNPRTMIQFSLDHDGPVSLRVYDLKGRLVADLIHGHLQRGTHDVSWSATGLSGSAVSSGIYVARIVAGGQTQSRRIAVVK